MASTTETKYYCDLCSRKLPTFKNNLTIVTEKNSSSAFWSRLSVKVDYCSGVHNDGTTRDAELCKPCAVRLLTDALKRVKAGERATKGSESSDLEGWHK